MMMNQSMKRSVFVALLMLNMVSTFVVSFVVQNSSPLIAGTRSQLLMSSLTNKEEEEEVVVAVNKNDNPRKVGLALMLDDGTRKSHSMAQNSAFVTGFFKGLASRDSYKALLTSLYFVYSAMEDAMEDATIDHRVKLMDDDVLRRVPSLQQDLNYFYTTINNSNNNNEDWQSQIQPSLATQAYVSRIRQIAQNPESSYLLLAHQYTRYLGDLFGGQMMGGMASKSLELTEENGGVSFYKFDNIPDTTDYITAWYTRLNQLDLTQEQKENIIDEANYVFDLNIGILQELDGNPLTAIWTLLLNTLRQNLNIQSPYN